MANPTVSAGGTAAHVCCTGGLHGVHGVHKWAARSSCRRWGGTRLVQPGRQQRHKLGLRRHHRNRHLGQREGKRVQAGDLQEVGGAQSGRELSGSGGALVQGSGVQ